MRRCCFDKSQDWSLDEHVVDNSGLWTTTYPELIRRISLARVEEDHAHHRIAPYDSPPVQNRRSQNVDEKRSTKKKLRRYNVPPLVIHLLPSLAFQAQRPQQSPTQPSTRRRGLYRNIYHFLGFTSPKSTPKNHQHITRTICEESPRDSRRRHPSRIVMTSPPPSRKIFWSPQFFLLHEAESPQHQPDCSSSPRTHLLPIIHEDEPPDSSRCRPSSSP